MSVKRKIYFCILCVINLHASVLLIMSCDLCFNVRKTIFCIAIILNTVLGHIVSDPCENLKYKSHLDILFID